MILQAARAVFGDAEAPNWHGGNEGKCTEETHPEAPTQCEHEKACQTSAHIALATHAAAGCAASEVISVHSVSTQLLLRKRMCTWVRHETMHDFAKHVLIEDINPRFAISFSVQSSRSRVDLLYRFQCPYHSLNDQNCSVSDTIESPYGRWKEDYLVS